jgi:hypothetical protein
MLKVSRASVGRAKKRMREDPQAHEAAKRGEKVPQAPVHLSESAYGLALSPLANDTSRIPKPSELVDIRSPRTKARHAKPAVAAASKPKDQDTARVLREIAQISPMQLTEPEAFGKSLRLAAEGFFPLMTMTFKK